MLKTTSSVINASQIATPITLPGDVTLSTGNLVMGTAGKGIDFSADPHASGMTSELLDDYEEGTWTPVVTSGSGAIATYNASGTYTKIGREVFVTFNIQITGNGTGAGFIKVAGFPYTISASRPANIGLETDTVGFVFSSQGITSTDFAYLLKLDGTYPGGDGYRLQSTLTYIV